MKRSTLQLARKLRTEFIPDSHETGVTQQSCLYEGSGNNDIQRIDISEMKKHFGDEWRNKVKSIREVKQPDGSIVKEYVIDDPEMVETFKSNENSSNIYIKKESSNLLEKMNKPSDIDVRKWYGGEGSVDSDREADSEVQSIQLQGQQLTSNQAMNNAPGSVQYEVIDENGRPLKLEGNIQQLMKMAGSVKEVKQPDGTVVKEYILDDPRILSQIKQQSSMDAEPKYYTQPNITKQLDNRGEPPPPPPPRVPLKVPSYIPQQSYIPTPEQIPQSYAPTYNRSQIPTQNSMMRERIASYNPGFVPYNQNPNKYNTNTMQNRVREIVPGSTYEMVTTSGKIVQFTVLDGNMTNNDLFEIQNTINGHFQRPDVRPQLGYNTSFPHDNNFRKSGSFASLADTSRDNIRFVDSNNNLRRTNSSAGINTISEKRSSSATKFESFYGHENSGYSNVQYTNQNVQSPMMAAPLLDLSSIDPSLGTYPIDEHGRLVGEIPPILSQEQLEFIRQQLAANGITLDLSSIQPATRRRSNANKSQMNTTYTPNNNNSNGGNYRNKTETIPIKKVNSRSPTTPPSFYTSQYKVQINSGLNGQK